MNGFNVSEAGHVVNIIPPVDITGGKIAQAFSMAGYKHASIVIQIGVSAAAPTAIILSVGTATAGVGTAVANATAIHSTPHPTTALSAASHSIRPATRPHTQLTPTNHTPQPQGPPA